MQTFVRGWTGHLGHAVVTGIDESMWDTRRNGPQPFPRTISLVTGLASLTETRGGSTMDELKKTTTPIEPGGRSDGAAPAAATRKRIEWDDLGSLRQELFNVWASGSEREWAKVAWRRLGSMGLTGYGDESERQDVLVRFFTLACIYHSFCIEVFEEGYDFETLKYQVDVSELAPVDDRVADPESQSGVCSLRLPVDFLFHGMAGRCTRRISFPMKLIGNQCDCVHPGYGDARGILPVVEFGPDPEPARRPAAAGRRRKLVLWRRAGR